MRRTLGTFAVLLATLIVGNANFNGHQNDDPKILQMVHVVMRHGVRTPVTTYPNDPYKDYEFPPNGWGTLTINGIQDLYNFGKELREFYGPLLGYQYNASEYHSESTGVDRAIASIMTVNSGLWESLDNAQRWNPQLNWYPVPVYSQPLNDDMLLLVRRDCPEYNIELDRVEHSEAVQRELFKYKELFEYVEHNSGQPMNTFNDIEDIYTTLLAESSYGLKLPQWTVGYFPDKMQTAASQSFVVKAFNDKLQRLKGGVLWKKILEDMTAKTSGSNAKKMIVYGGHDTTVSNLLSSLKIFDAQVPSYGMAIYFELYFDTEKSNYGVEIYVKNSTLPRVQMRLPGCEVLCPLERVAEITQKVIPVDWTKECATSDPDYSTPPPRGP